MKLRFKRQLKKSGSTILFGLLRITKSKGKGWGSATVNVDPIRLLALIGVLAVLGYIGGVAAAYSIRSKRPYNEITLTDIAFPWNWSGLSEKAGNTNLTHGKALMEEGDYRNALHMLRSGLMRKPDDHDARFMLAQIYQAIGQSEAATNILDIGLNYGPPEDPQYTQFLLVLLAMREDYESISSVSRKLRAFPQVRDDADMWKKLADLELNALKKSRDFEKLLEYAEEMRAIDPNEPRYEDLEILSKIKLGFIDDAVAQMETQPLARKHSPQYRYLEAMIALQTDDLAALDKHYDAIMKWPTNPYPLQGQMIIELDYAGLNDRRDQRIAEYLDNYARNAAALELGLRLFYRFQDVAQNDALVASISALQPDKAQNLALVAIQSRIQDQRYTEANQMFQQWLSEVPEESSKQYKWLNQLLITLIEKRQDDRLDLVKYMQENRLPNEAYKITADTLFDAGDYETAEHIAESGLQFYPHDEDLATLRRESLAQR